MPIIRVTMLPAGKRKPEKVEWEYKGDNGLRGAKSLANSIAGHGFTTGQGGAETTVYPVQRIEKVEVFEDGQA